MRLVGRQGWLNENWSVDIRLASLSVVFAFHFIPMVLLVYSLLFHLSFEYAVPVLVMAALVLVEYFTLYTVVPIDLCKLVQQWLDIQFVYPLEQLHNPHKTVWDAFGGPESPHVAEYQTACNLITDSVQRQFKIPPSEYLRTSGLVFLFSALPVFIPNVGGAFYARYVSIYKSQSTLEMYLTSPVLSVALEFLWSYVLFRLVFLFFR